MTSDSDAHRAAPPSPQDRARGCILGSVIGDAFGSVLAILFVENHSVFARTVIDAFLSTHAVDLVPSIAAASEAISRRAYDVALVDYDLDDGKGDELVARLRASGSRMLVIGVSSHAVGNAALVRAGADATCGKLQFADIGETLERLAKRLHEQPR